MVGGHIGRNRLFFRIRAKYRWKNMSRDVRDFVKKCHKCQINKAKIRNIEPLKITETEESSLQKIVIDTLGPLKGSINGNQYALTIIDDLTKYLVMIPIANKEARTVARALMDHYILTFGPVRTILSDRGTEYVNKVSEELFQLFKISHKTSVANRHQTVGTIERTHRVFNEYMRGYLEKECDWETNMKYFTFCYNTTPHTSFNYQYTPFELTFGKRSREIMFLGQEKIDPLYNVDSLAKEIKFRLQNAHKRAAELIKKSKEIVKINYDTKCRPIDLKLNDKVVLVNESRQKFDPVYSGTYIVIKIIDHNVEIEDVNTKKRKLVHKDNVRKYLA